MANQQQQTAMHYQQQPGEPQVIYAQPQAGYNGTSQQNAGPSDQVVQGKRVVRN